MVAVCADATCQTIPNRTEIPRTAAGFDIAVAIDSNDIPVLAVDDADGGLKSVRCDDAACTSVDITGFGFVGAENVSIALDEFDNPAIAYFSSVLRCTDPSCDSFTITSFSGDAVYRPIDSPEIVLDADGRPTVVWEGEDNRLRFGSCGDSLCGSSGLAEYGPEYHIQNVATGEYLDPQPDGTVLMSVEPTLGTRFEAPLFSTGIHTLRTLDFRTFLEADGNLVDQSFGAQRDNRWRIVRNADGTHTISSDDSGYTMVAVGSDVRLRSNPGASAQDRWQFVPAIDRFSIEIPYRFETVALQNVATGRWLDGDANGGVDQSVNQQADDAWFIQSSRYSDGYAALENNVHERFLDADRNNINVKSSITKGIDDSWEIVEVSPGIVTLRNVRFDGYLTAQEADNNFNVVRSDTVSPNAQWQVVVID